MSDFALTGRLGLDARAFRTGMGQAGKATQDTARDVAKLGDELDDVDGRNVKAELEVEHRQALRDLARVERDLQAVDGTQAEPMVRAEVDQAQSRLDDIEAEMATLDSTIAEPTVEAKDPEGAGSNAASLFTGAVGRFMAVGAIAGFIATAFNAGMDRIRLVNRMESMFGQVESEARDSVKRAAGLYADGWGESVDDIAVALGRVEQQLGDILDATGESSEEVTKAALAIADVWGTDVDSTIRSIGQLLKNDLVDDADAASDAIVFALQNGADTAGDLTDSIDEYAQHYAGLGLSASDMMAQFIAGIETGQRDTDKLADAVKEFGLRTGEFTQDVADAYTDLGLNADETNDKIQAGGSAARQAFLEVLRALDMVEDPSEQFRLGVELLGTQFEDLGPRGLDALLAIRDGMEIASDATEDLVRNQQESVSQIELLWRRASGGLTWFGEQLAESANGWIDLVEHGPKAFSQSVESEYDRVQKVVDDFAGGSLQDLQEAMEEAGVSTDFARIQSRAFTHQLGYLIDETAGLAGTMVQGEIDAALWAQGVRNARDATNEAERAAEEAAAAVRDHRNAMRESVDPAFRAMQAQDRLTEALAELNAEGGNTPENLRNVAKAQMELDDANFDVAESTSAATEEFRLMMERAGLTQQQMGMLTADINRTEQAAESFAGGYEARVTADTAQAERQIATLASPRTVTLTAVYTGGTIRIPTRTSTHHVALDSGGQIGAGATALVAERRPEFVNGALIHTPTIVQGPATVTGGAATAALLGGQSSAVTPAHGFGAAPNVVTPSTDVRVFIGERELTDIVDVQVMHRQNETAAAIAAGRR